MKSLRKIMALLIAMVMVLAMSISAFAAGNERTNGQPLTDRSITLTNPSKGHTYELYQIFTGTYETVDGKDTLGNVAWGNGVTEAGQAKFGNAADYSKTIGTTSDAAKTFANTINQYLTNGSYQTAGETELVWSGLTEGFYIIKDVTAANDLPEGDTTDLVVVQVLDNVEIAAKSGTVEFDKKVEDRNDSTMKPTVYDEWGNTSDYDVDDDVPYKVTIKLPQNFSEYKTYQMTMHDDMEAGLIFNDDVKVYVGDSTTALTGGYTVTKNSNDHTFEIAFPEVKDIQGAGNNVTFTITYSAKLTGEGVVYGNPGNHNEAWLTYSNNPVTGGEGGTTPHKTTVTFTYKVEVDKVDEAQKPLAGAAFTLEKKVMAEDETTNWEALGLKEGSEGTIFTFDGLDDGEYRITETKTPAGYNSIDTIYFVVEAGHTTVLDSLTATQQDKDSGEKLDTNTATATFSATLTKSADTDVAGLIDTKVVNKQGSQLPSTGGMGTTLFYIVGGILVAGAAIILIAKRKVNA